MTVSSLARYAFCAGAASILLAGCNSGSTQTTPGAPAALQGGSERARQIAMMTPLGSVPARHLNRNKSWIEPDAGKQWLLYVSDGASGTIDIYNYRDPAGKLFGQITGFSFPYALCLDRERNVYVVDNDKAKIYEFAHGGITPIATAKDKYGNPIGCSVDPTTGNVAVANFNGPASGAGGMDIFAGGLGGSQTNYSDQSLFHLWPPGYDPNGNLFVLGLDYSGAGSFAELPAGGSAFKMLSGLTIEFPGSVGWDGSYLTATDQNYQSAYTTMVYRITVSHSAVTIVRKTHLTDTCYPNNNWMVAVQPFTGGVTQNAVVAGNLNCPSRENFFNYTSGGNPKWSEPPAIAPSAPYGQVVSPPLHAH